MVALNVSQPWQDPRTGIWKLRKRIPQQYRSVAGQRGDTIELSTGTADRHEAKRRWPDLLRQWSELEAEWERRVNLVVLTADRAKEVTAVWVSYNAAGGRLETDGETPTVRASGHSRRTDACPRGRPLKFKPRPGRRHSHHGDGPIGSWRSPECALARCHNYQRPTFSRIMAFRELCDLPRRR